MTKEQNTRLVSAMHAIGLTPSRLGELVQVDEKSVERWIRDGREPHSRNRWAVARALQVEPSYLWPPPAGASTGDVAHELVAMYQHRGEVPARLWTDLVTGPTASVGVLVYSGLPWFEANPAVLECLRRRADDGVQIRLALGDPDSDAVGRRGEEEGIDMAARVRNALRVIEPLVGNAGIHIRLHSTTLYASLYLAERELLANHHILGTPAAQAPVLHLRRTPDGFMFDRYARSFEAAWAGAREYP